MDTKTPYSGPGFHWGDIFGLSALQLIQPNRTIVMELLLVEPIGSEQSQDSAQ
jgi:hypothetical protein